MTSWRKLESRARGKQAGVADGRVGGLLLDSDGESKKSKAETP